MQCDGREEEGDSQRKTSNNRPKSTSDGTMNKRQAREKELDSIYTKLKKKHDDTYSAPQLRLWARMIISGMHDDLENPPQVPMIVFLSIPNKNQWLQLLQLL